LFLWCWLRFFQDSLLEIPSPVLGSPGEWPDTSPILSGRASFYGTAFSGRKTASGEHFDHQTISAASNRFPLGALVAVRRVLSARCVVVRINDRMGHRSRLIDLSREAAVRLGMIEAGVTEVEVVALPKYLKGHEQRLFARLHATAGNCTCMPATGLR
jgi:rare lipoprotein A